MVQNLYFILPIEGFTEKLIKITGTRILVAWSYNSEKHTDIYEFEDFINHKEGPMIEISEKEYDERFNELFPE
jgi:hypothetical protein